jgi:hypothetical protein
MLLKGIVVDVPRLTHELIGQITNISHILAYSSLTRFIGIISKLNSRKSGADKMVALFLSNHLSKKSTTNHT